MKPIQSLNGSKVNECSKSILKSIFGSFDGMLVYIIIMPAIYAISQTINTRLIVESI